MTLASADTIVLVTVPVVMEVAAADPTRVSLCVRDRIVHGWTLVDAAWTPQRAAGASADNGNGSQAGET